MLSVCTIHNVLYAMHVVRPVYHVFQALLYAPCTLRNEQFLMTLIRKYHISYSPCVVCVVRVHGMRRVRACPKQTLAF